MKNFVKILSLCFVSLLILPVSVTAQDAQSKKKVKTDSIPLEGYVYDRLTSRELLQTKIRILRPDSSLISTAKGGRTFWDYKKGIVKEDSTSYYEIFLPRVQGDYIIHISRDGYEDLYEPYKAEFSSRTSELKAPKLYLSRQKVRELEEFTVKSSKIKFYNKGDTIVYNADAFSLPEGSMLDALVRQMPGVEIKGNKIYVNGRFVESLLLNGKDFFKGDQSVAMQNIGAYAVKNVAVYEKADEAAALLGDRADIDKEYVMDVRLKKDYMAGTAMNAEAGYGLDNKYLGRLFGLGYTNNSRLSLYGNLNNINLSNRLNQDGQDYSTEYDSGIVARANGGIDYNVDNALHTWEINGNVDAKYTDRTERVTSNAVQYLQAADNFAYSDKNTRKYDLSLSTNHQFKLNHEGWNLRITPSFDYNRDKTHKETYSATFDKEFDGLNREIVENLYSQKYANYTSALINRNLEFYNSSEHGYKGELALASKIKIPNSPDAVELKGNIRYKRNTLWGTTLQDICFGADEINQLAPTTSLLQRRDEAIRPDYTFRLLGLARYYFNLPVGSLNLSYEYIHTQNRKNSGLMMLESMAQGAMAEFQPGQIPMPDMANSYTSKSYKNQHHLKLIYGMNKKYDSGKFDMKFEPSVFLERHDLFYNQGDAFVDPARTFWRFKIDNTYLRWTSKDNKSSLSLMYTLNQEAPNLLKTVDIPNTTDPMNIWLGNPDLKMATKHRITVYLRNKFGKYTSQYVSLFGDFAQNDFANGYRYDSATGIRQMRTYNVNGNNSFYLNHSIYQDLDKQGVWSIRNSISGQLVNDHNMIGYDSDPMQQKSRQWGFMENLSLSKGFSDTDIIAFDIYGGIDWYRSTAFDPNPTKNVYGAWEGGAFVNLKLPLNISFNTSADLYKYFGYIDSSMNRLLVNWGATLSYSMLKGNLRFNLKATDLLNNSIRQGMVVSATGHTQNEVLSLGRVIMLSVAYKFHIKPKRK
ncbi:MAG: outer membrane beta-barrel family protein [Muribaculaceae bacterium]|nr:outer membrane beta-barrel family protein [Muribaculaceae bacterium]